MRASAWTDKDIMKFSRFHVNQSLANAFRLMSLTLQIYNKNIISSKFFSKKFLIIFNSIDYQSFPQIFLVPTLRKTHCVRVDGRKLGQQFFQLSDKSVLWVDVIKPIDNTTQYGVKTCWHNAADVYPSIVHYRRYQSHIMRILAQMSYPCEMFRQAVKRCADMHQNENN